MSADDKAPPEAAIVWHLAACCDRIIEQGRRQIAQHRERLKGEAALGRDTTGFEADLDAFEKSIEETAHVREGFQPYLDTLRESRDL